MNIWHDIDPKRITPDDFVALIEIPKGCSCKYELDKETGLLRLDRILYTATHYPANYGFIPATYADDNDPLVVLVLCSAPVYPMTLIRVYPIGVMRMLVTLAPTGCFFAKARAFSSTAVLERRFISACKKSIYFSAAFLPSVL